MSLRHARRRKAEETNAQEMLTAGLISRDEYNRLTRRKPKPNTGRLAIHRGTNQ